MENYPDDGRKVVEQRKKHPHMKTFRKTGFLSRLCNIRIIYLLSFELLKFFLSEKGGEGSKVFEEGEGDHPATNACEKGVYDLVITSNT